MRALLADYGRLLDKAGMAHHLDREDGVVRLVFVTRRYRNLRGERLAIVTLTAADDGRSCQATIERAFAAGDDPAATCLAACRLAQASRGVAVAVDAASATLSLSMTTVLEGTRLTGGQLLAMIDTLVMTAEAWCERIRHATRRPGARRGVHSRAS